MQVPFRPQGRLCCNHFIMKTRRITLSLLASLLLACSSSEPIGHDVQILEPAGSAYESQTSNVVLSRTQYRDQLEGFWLAQCIANWTGLVTEMDKIGGEGLHGQFYTREDWGQPDTPNIWDNGAISSISPTIDFVFRGPDEVWGADDDTDIEYIYQHLLYEHQTSILSGELIRDGWIAHIYNENDVTPFGKDEDRYQNYLWVSNQTAHSLMLAGKSPPATSDPAYNEHWEMIDAQLTTEIFGLFAPARPDIALEMARLPIRTTARGNAVWASEFYVVMHALASAPYHGNNLQERTAWMADQARRYLPDESYSAAMYDFVKQEYLKSTPWEDVRDQLYVKYQVNQEDGYDITSRKLYCNGCFASGINFGASIISLLYGEGDLRKTIQIGVLTGWDADNPTATWGGLLGFMLGKQGVETAFNRKFSDRFNIHRTRKGFANNGIDTFDDMARKGIAIVDRVVREEMDGRVDELNDTWLIPLEGVHVKSLTDR